MLHDHCLDLILAVNHLYSGGAPRAYCCSRDFCCSNSKSPGFVQDACTAFPGHIMVGLDARDGKVATDGWSKITGHEVIDLAKKFEDYGVEAIVYTDIGRDGMLKGVNMEATVKLAQAIRIPVIASGGLSNNQDIAALCEAESEGVMGVIAGRSIYAGDLDLTAAQQYADELTLKFSNYS